MIGGEANEFRGHAQVSHEYATSLKLDENILTPSTDCGYAEISDLRFPIANWSSSIRPASSSHDARVKSPIANRQSKITRFCQAITESRRLSGSTRVFRW